MDTALALTALPDHSTIVPEEARPECLHVRIDEAFLDILLSDVETATAQLERDVDEMTWAVDSRLLVLRRLYTLLYSVDIIPDDAVNAAAVFIDSPFQHFIFALVTGKHAFDVRLDRGAPSGEIADALSIDYISLATIYIVLRLFSGFLSCVNAVRRGLRSEDLSSEEMSLEFKFNDKNIQQRVEVIWANLWEYRTEFFRLEVLQSSVNIVGETETVLLCDALSDCLAGLASMKSATPTWPRDVNIYAIRASFHTWIYAPHDHARKPLIVRHFYEDLLHCNEHTTSAWLADVLMTSHERSKFVAAFRRGMVDRKTESDILFAYLYTFYTMSPHAKIKVCMEEFVSDTAIPIRWLLRCLQRSLCVHTEDGWRGRILLVSLGAMTYWCDHGDLNLIEIVQARIGVPLIPYLGYLALHLIQDVESRLVHPIFRDATTITRACLLQAQSLGHRVPFVQAAITRRAWITIKRTVLDKMHHETP